MHMHTHAHACVHTIASGTQRPARLGSVQTDDPEPCVNFSTTRQALPARPPWSAPRPASTVTLAGKTRP